MHILITGASGFVGSNLIPYLEKNIPGITFSCVVRKKSNERREILWEELEQQHLANTDAVIHLAGKAHDTSNTVGEEEYFKVNYELTAKLYDLFLQSAADKFIYISSVKAAADSAAAILTEDQAPYPLTAYGRSKLKAEEYIREKGKGYDKKYFILRPSMIHGPGNKGNLNLLYRFVKTGFPYPLAAFENRRSFLSIDNLCFVIKRLLELDIKSGIYNLADDESMPTTELIRIIGDVQNKKTRLLEIPQGLIKRLARLGDFLKLPLNSERLKKLTENYVVSNRKIKHELRIEKMPVSARAGLAMTIRSFE